MGPDKDGQNSAISLQEQIEQEEMLEKQGTHIYIYVVLDKAMATKTVTSPELYSWLPD